MNCAQIRVFKEANQICLGGLLQSDDGRRLKADSGLKVLGDFADQALKWKLTDKQFGRLLVAADLAKRHGARAPTMGLLLDATGFGALPSSFIRELLARSLSPRRLTRNLLCACHDFICV